MQMLTKIQLIIKKKILFFYLSQSEDYNPGSKFSESSEYCSASWRHSHIYFGAEGSYIIKMANWILGKDW